MANLKEEEVRASKETAKEMQMAANMGILTVDTDGQTRPLREQEDVNWHELTNAFRTRKVLSGMLGAELDFIVRDMDQKTRSIVASRKEAMLRKRLLFYFNEGTDGYPMVRPGRIVEARVIAVAPKAVRLEVFGVECSLKARDMAWEWMVDANDKFANGDIVLVKVLKMTAESPENIRIEVSAKEAQTNTNKENLMRLHKQGKYVGKITDVYKGTYFIHLNNGVNAVAHSCNTASLPGRKDGVDYYVHFSEIQMDGFRKLKNGQEVSFEARAAGIMAVLFLMCTFPSYGSETATPSNAGSFASAGHIYDLVTEETEATCLLNGSRIVTCWLCQDYRKEIILPMLGHCDENGDFLCDRCGVVLELFQTGEEQTVKTDLSGDWDEMVLF